ncbi:MAG: DUF1496 domain-containing protein [Aquabacterium sp.]
MQVMTQQQLSQVAGGTPSTCTYNSQSYSQGAVVSVGGGYFQQCQSGGYWSSPYRLQ